jgi:hypothetical protein
LSRQGITVADVSSPASTTAVWPSGVHLASSPGGAERDAQAVKEMKADLPFWLRLSRHQQGRGERERERERERGKGGGTRPGTAKGGGWGGRENSGGWGRGGKRPVTSGGRRKIGSDVSDVVNGVDCKLPPIALGVVGSNHEPEQKGKRKGGGLSGRKGEGDGGLTRRESVSRREEEAVCKAKERIRAAQVMSPFFICFLTSRP